MRVTFGCYGASTGFVRPTKAARASLLLGDLVALGEATAYPGAHPAADLRCQPRDCEQEKAIYCALTVVRRSALAVTSFPIVMGENVTSPWKLRAIPRGSHSEFSREGDCGKLGCLPRSCRVRVKVSTVLLGSEGRANVLRVSAVKGLAAGDATHTIALAYPNPVNTVEAPTFLRTDHGGPSSLSDLLIFHVQ